MKKILFYLILILLIIFSGCNKTDNILSPSEREEGWELLFDGKTLEGWHDYLGDTVKGPWLVEKGCLTGLGKGSDSLGYLISDKEYESFMLTFDWKLAKEGNSGVFYHVDERPVFRVPYATGPEYQVIDEIGILKKRNLKELNRVGANYAMHPASTDESIVRKSGEWNSSKIIFDNGHVEHWLNGKRIVEFEAWTDDWFARKTGGKNADFPEYGLAHSGRFGLQDHGSKVWYKNMKVKKLARKPREEEVLFNGRNLTGWDVFGTEKWYVENGELICESGPDKGYGYFATRKYFNDFDLKLDFKQIANGNSGVFIRSVTMKNQPRIAKLGWQVEVAPPKMFTAGIYESGGGRGWVIKPSGEKDKILKMGKWNTMRIRAEGDKVTTWLNGEQMIDLKDDKIGNGKGRIMLQIHSGGGIKVHWRNMLIKEL
jgi:hypothetical protein